jgi:hypothetical protein
MTLNWGANFLTILPPRRGKRMWGEKKERCDGSIVGGEVAAGVGRVDKGDSCFV